MYGLLLTMPLVLLAAISPLAFAQSVSPTAFEALDEPRNISIVEASGHTYALVISYLDKAVQVINITNPANPVPVTVIRDSDDGFDAVADGYTITTVEIDGSTYLLVASLGVGVQVMDVTDPAAPVSTAVIRDGTDGFFLPSPSDFAVVATSDGTYVMVALLQNSAIQIINMTDPDNPVPVAVIHDDMDGFDSLGGVIGIDTLVAGERTYALTASSADNAVQIIDMTDPTSPEPFMSLQTGDDFTLKQPTHIDIFEVSGRTYAFLLSLAESTLNVVDVTNIAAPVQVAAIRDGEAGFDALWAASRIAKLSMPDATYAFVSGYLDHSIQVVDITDPRNPEPVATVSDGQNGFDGLRGASGLGVFATDDSAYLLVTSYLDDAVQIIDVSTPHNPVPVTAIFDYQGPVAVEALPDQPDEGRIIHGDFDITSIESRVVAKVADTVAQYAAEGQDAFEAINEGTLTEHYPFVLDKAATKMIANGAFPYMAGAAQDTFGEADRPLDHILADISRDGGTWVNHMFPNPDTGVVQQKRSWLYMHDGHIFGSGYYLHDSQVQSLVNEAVDLYRSVGDDALGMITPDERIITDELYVFVLDVANATTLAHGITPSEVGTVSDTLSHKSSKPYDQIINELELYGHTWVSYVFLNPDAGTPQLKRAWLHLHDGYAFISGYYLPDSRVMSLAEGAQLMYQSHGGEASFDVITPETPTDRELLYPYVLNATTNVEVANGASPDDVGLVFSDIAQQDRTNEEILEELNRDGDAWASYVLTNPSTGTEQVQRVWMQIHDGYIFASGYYLPDARVQASVDQAVSTFKSIGTAAFGRINDGDLVIDDHGPIVLTKAFVQVAGPDFLHVDKVGGLAVSSDLDLFTAYSRLADDGSAWIETVGLNPGTNSAQTIRAWAYVFDDYVFQSGYYVLDSVVQSLVDKTIFTYKIHGEDTFDIIAAEEGLSTDALYPFIISADDYTTIAHGALPSMVDVCCSDAIRLTSDRSFDEILAELDEDGGAWATYVFTNPGTGTEQEKRAWLQLHGDYIFGSGYYITDSQVRTVVNNAIHAYDADPSAAFDMINAISNDEPIETYPFVIDATTHKIVAHGADTDRVGTISTALADAHRSAEEILAALGNEPGTWSHYVAVNPVTGEEEAKRAWLSLHGGYVFGSGYYDVKILE